MNKMVQNILRSSAKLALGALVLAASFGTASAQNPTVLNAPLWKQDALAAAATGTGSWFKNDGNTRGFGYNPATGNLLVVSRTGGLKIVKLNAATGDSVGVLDVTGISGGTFALSLIDVTPTGRIFAANLVSPASPTSVLKIYTWENETSVPVVAYSGDLNGSTMRWGDSFRLDWTDGARNVYVGGSNNPNLAKFTWADNALTLTSVFNFGAVNNLVMRAVRGMAPIVGQDSLWINEFDYTVKKISTVTGAIGTVIPALTSGFDILKASLWLDYADFNGKKLFAAFPGSLIASGQSASLVDVATNAELAFTAAGPNPNGNASGGPLFDVANKRMYLLATNNQIASYDISAFVPADPVNIKFTVNTSTIRDTVKTTDLVQIRGVVNGAEQSNYFGQTVNWGSGSIALENEGGDYWSKTLKLLPGDVLTYKLYTAKPGVDGMVDHSTGGWESNSSLPSGNYEYTVPANASGTITLPVIFYNRSNPLEHSKTDTVAIRFRVNVGAQFATGEVTDASRVGVRGTPSVMGNPDNWGSTNVYLTREPMVEGNRNVFYSGLHYVPVSQAGTNFMYKYVIENGSNTTWESTPDRPGKVSPTDTTFVYSFFSGMRPPSRAVVAANVQFAVNVGVLEELGFFNRAVGDSILVRGGFNGFGTGSKAAFNAVTNNWVRNDNITAEVGSVQKYKYFIQWDPSRFVVDGPNHIRNLTANNGWEEPGQFGGGDREYTFTDGTTQDIGSTFYNSIPPYGVIRSTTSGNTSMPVTFRVDMTAALSHTAPFNPATDSVFLFAETTFFALTQGLPVGDNIAAKLLNATPELRERVMFRPVSGEPNIYELTLNVTLPTENHIGFTIAYRRNADNTPVFSGPGGFNAGRRYYRYIRPIDFEDQENIIWPDNATLSPIVWTKENLDFEAPLCYCEQDVSVDRNVDLATEYALSQNYPNPFNPSTTISFNLPQSGNVTLTVYNVLGQQVATLVNGALSAGTHSVPFNASRLASGVYIYELRAGSFVQQKRMMLVK